MKAQFLPDGSILYQSSKSKKLNWSVRMINLAWFTTITFVVGSLLSYLGYLYNKKHDFGWKSIVLIAFYCFIIFASIYQNYFSYMSLKHFTVSILIENTLLTVKEIKRNGSIKELIFSLNDVNVKIDTIRFGRFLTIQSKKGKILYIQYAEFDWEEDIFNDIVERVKERQSML